MIKQVIVMRKDLNMRKGKMVAQGCHASMACLLNNMLMYDGHGKGKEEFLLGQKDLKEKFGDKTGQAFWDYINGKCRFTKICVGVNSEQELLDVYQKAVAAKLPCSLIKDAGLTEFGGVPTLTCCGIGPAPADLIDAITGELTLL